MPVAKTAGVRAGRLFSIFLLISQIFLKVNTRTSLLSYSTGYIFHPIMNQSITQ